MDKSRAQLAKRLENTGTDIFELSYKLGGATLKHQLSPVLALGVLANIFNWSVDIEPTGQGDACKVTLETEGATITKHGISPEDACAKAFFVLAQQAQ